MLKVDFHTHIISEDFLDLANKYGDDRWPVLEKTCNCGANIMIKGKNLKEIRNKAWDAEKRLEDMDRKELISRFYPLYRLHLVTGQILKKAWKWQNSKM